LPPRKNRPKMASHQEEEGNCSADEILPDYDGFRDYIARKQAKLLEQQKQDIPQHSSLFIGLRFHVNGYTDPPLATLKALLVSHGGRYEQYYPAPRPDLYMLSTHLPKAKQDKMGAAQIVIRPQWVLDCIQAGRLLDTAPYRLYHANTVSEHGIESFFKADKRDVPAFEPTTQRTTATDPNFVQNFYKSSRLHHLSTWREDLKTFAKELMSQKGEGTLLDGDSPLWIMHIDMDCFFASVSSRNRPELEDRPVGISHATSSHDKSSSDLASVNYAARAFGLKNGMYLRRAIELCPDLTVLPYDFEAYQQVAYELYRILAKHAAVLQAVSCDEAFIGVVEASHDKAEQIREEIFAACRCHASIGIGENMLLARLATKKAKPKGQFTVDDPTSFMSEQKLSDLPGIGPSITARLTEEGWHLCKDLYDVPLPRLQALLGPKLGKSIYDFARGIDERLIDEGLQQRKSVGTEISWGVRFDSAEQRDHFIHELASEVMTRLAAAGPSMTAKKMNLKLMKRQADAGEPSKRLGRGLCDSLHKLVNLPTTSGKLTVDILAQEAIKAIDSYAIPITDIRGIGIFLTSLEEHAGPTQKGFDWSQLAKKRPAVNPKKSYLAARGVAAEVFAELDAQLQEDLLHEWGFYDPVPDDDDPTSVDLTPKKSKLTTQQQNKSPIKPAAVKIIDLLKTKTKEPSVEMPSRSELIEMGIDPEFYDALPDCLRLEIVQDYQHQHDNDITARHEVVEIASSSQEDNGKPLTSHISLAEMHDLSTGRAWEQMHELLKRHDYEQVSRFLGQIRDHPGSVELTTRVQAWFQEHVGGTLHIP